MAEEFRYPLTRICLRSGSLTLPMALRAAFPEDGEVVAVDSTKGAEFELQVSGRRVDGLSSFFELHGLEVNDELVIRPLEDGRLALTPFKRERRPDFTRPEALRRLMDEIVESNVPATEAEIRAVHPEIPAAFPLREALEREPRLALHEGRWQSRLAVEAIHRAAEVEAQRRRDEARRRAEAAEREEAQRRAEAAERAAAERAAAERSAAEHAAAERSAAEQAAAERAVAEERARYERERLNLQAAEDARAAAQRQRQERAAQRSREEDQVEDQLDAELGPGAERRDDDLERFEWDQPTPRGFRLPWQRPRAAKEAPPARASGGPATNDPFRLDRLGEARPSRDRATVHPTPRAGAFPGEASLPSATTPAADPAKTKRAREAFAGLGYRVEGLAHGQLMLHADMGRHKYRVLLHVLPDGERLDWAALLARRRESNAKYLAVVGDHRDLHRLTAPADLARATLWSWAGLDRVVELGRAVVIGPIDLEPHFERDGVFEYGLERFERTVAKRVQERGTLSAVLTALAGMRAPSVFVLEDLAAHGDVPRDQLVRTLDRLSEAPFHLIARVDTGEYCLRYRVHEALEGLGTYASSLRARLPERHRDRVRGLPEGVDPIGAEDIDAGALDARASDTPRGAAAERTGPPSVADAGEQEVAVSVVRRAPTPKANVAPTPKASAAPSSPPRRSSAPIPPFTIDRSVVREAVAELGDAEREREPVRVPQRAKRAKQEVRPREAEALPEPGPVVDRRVAPDQEALFSGPGFADDFSSDFGDQDDSGEDVDVSAVVRTTRKPPKR